MTFPVPIPVGPFRLHPHVVFDVLAYSIGFRLFLWERRRLGDTIDTGARWSVVAAAVFGAAIGSKLFFWLEDPAETLAHWNDLRFLLGGKTIVGGLIGGLAGVELEKRWTGLTRRTGDLFAMPIAAGIAIGRIGCFLSGLPDRTFGTPSALPWAVDFGDGIPRHPTQLYESAVMAVVAVLLGRLTRHPHREGDVFKLFMVSYFALRLGVDALKPEVRIFLGLSSLQWASVAVLVYYGHDVLRWVRDGWTDD
ncbi:MAG TPA: prolipoprotein diacylglyceryl transferase family protein [Vicinamibacterales bacterium]|nr:prolipoprotein diacylglyceryl transferase family protein [Vicinamibacterales bacterium]